MLRVFIGYDERQAVTYNVLQHSINALASKPVSITALRISQLPIKRCGLTPFTYSRFLVPYLCDFEGVALFLDADILLKDDISKLFEYVEEAEKACVNLEEAPAGTISKMALGEESAHLDAFDLDWLGERLGNGNRIISELWQRIESSGDVNICFKICQNDAREIMELLRSKEAHKAVYVSKNPHRFEWASVMLFNCGHEANKVLTPDYVETADNLHAISWCKENEIGELPNEWNHLVGYDEPNPDAKLIHYTQGIPAFPETHVCEYSQLWASHQKAMNSTVPWDVLMGNSIHSVEVNGKRMPKFLFDLEKGEPKPQYVEHIRGLLGVGKNGDVRRNEGENS